MPTSLLTCCTTYPPPCGVSANLDLGLLSRGKLMLPPVSARAGAKKTAQASVSESLRDNRVAAASRPLQSFFEVPAECSLSVTVNDARAGESSCWLRNRSRGRLSASLDIACLLIPSPVAATANVSTCLPCPFLPAPPSTAIADSEAAYFRRCVNHPRELHPRRNLKLTVTIALHSDLGTLTRHNDLVMLYVTCRRS